MTMTQYTVLLLYPDYLNDTGTQTYLAHVEALDANAGIELAQRQAIAAQGPQDVEDEDSDYFAPLAVFKGHLIDEPLFNQ